MNLYTKLRQGFIEAVKENHLENETLTVAFKTLTPEEAIGITGRKDYPILNGKEVMLEADFRGAKGQAFTISRSMFQGNLQDVLEGDIEENAYDRALFIAAFNAVMRYLGRCDRSIHCRDEEPELCGRKFLEYMKENASGRKIALIGYQPSILANLAETFSIRVLEVNPELVGSVKSGVVLEDGITSSQDVLDWADLILCTGSVLCNGTLEPFLHLDKPTYFYGTTIAAAAPVLGIERLCFCSV